MDSCKPEHHDIIEGSSDFFRNNSLTPFMVPLPLVGNSASSYQKGIREKIQKNRSVLVTDFNPECDIIEYCRGFHDSSSSSTVSCNVELDLAPVQDDHILSEMHRFVDRLTSTDVNGFAMILAEKLSSSTKSTEPSPARNTTEYYGPVAGGIVEAVDASERDIRAIWCRRSIPQPFSDALLRVFTIRLLSQALLWPGSSSGPSKGKAFRLISIKYSHMVTFPIAAYRFIIAPEGLGLSPHFETNLDGGDHNDHPTTKCKCSKLQSDPEASKFWGISESRFLQRCKSNIGGSSARNFILKESRGLAPARGHDSNSMLTRSRGQSTVTSMPKKRTNDSRNDMTGESSEAKSDCEGTETRSRSSHTTKKARRSNQEK